METPQARFWLASCRFGTAAGDRRYIAARSEAGMAAATVNLELAILKAAYRAGSRLEMVEHVPAFPKKLKEAKPRQGFIEESTYQRLVRACSVLWLRTFLALGFNYGCRKSEMLSLQVADVDLLNGWLTIRDSKNGESRRLKLTAEVKTLLTECVRDKRPDSPVLTHEDGSAVCQPRKNWYALCCACGLGQFDEQGGYTGLQMHDLRRSAVRRMIRRGMQEDTAMKYSGHKTRSVFSRYNIVAKRDVEQAVSLLESQTVTETVTSNISAAADSRKSLN